MAMDFGTTQMNELFIQALQDPQMKKEAADKAAEYLKLQIYESGFMGRILPAQSISPMQCDRDPDSPNYQVVIDKEFIDVAAVTTSFRGRSHYDYIETERYAVKFFSIQSPEYSLTEEELRGMRQPIQTLIRHHIAFYIEKKMDEMFIGMCNAAIAASGLEIDLSAGTEYKLTTELLTRLRNLIDRQQPQYLKPATLLCTQAQWNQIYTWLQPNTGAGAGTGIGMTGGYGTDFWRDGYQYDKLGGLRVVITRKNDIVLDNEIYLFTDPEYLGHHFTFNDDRFSIEHQHNVMRWKGFRTFGAAIGNVNSVAKLKLAAMPS